MLLDGEGPAPKKDVKRKDKKEPPPERDGPPEAPANISNTNIGSTINQIFGDGTIDQSTRVEKLLPPPVIVKTGDGVLDAKQKARIQELKDRVVLVCKARQEPLDSQGVFIRLNRHMKVNSYHEIKQTDFEKALAFLRRLSGIGDSLKSAHVKNPGWRKRRISAIHARCKERGWEAWRVKYMKEKFGRESMVEMPDVELEKLYMAVMAKK